ncbi:MAG TPA: aldehyde dehydrogenase family protein [Acidimicrobiales bacterium]|nr:aldehyde dehydrogenase family protein [Acidimicrobiales bacterium]
MELHSVNPATGEHLGTYPAYDENQIDGMIGAAHSAAAQWASTPAWERCAVLASAADCLRRHRDELAVLMTLEMGKPVTQSRAEVDKCATAFDWYARNAERLLSDEPVDRDDVVAAAVAYRPLGVVLAVMPWNFPLWQVTRAVAPALAAGNVMLLKHADNVTGTALAFERLMSDAGTPPGVFSTLVVGRDAVAGVIADDRVAAATVTGSPAAGRAVASAAGAALKKTVLELGGSDPFVVLADADLEAAARVAVRSRFQNAGQSCIAAKRIIAVEAVADRLTELLLAGVDALVVGDPLQEDTDIGPLARVDLRDQLADQVARSVDAGGRVLRGGRAPDRPGAWYEPTVLAGDLLGTPMTAEETFGPAAPILRVADEEAALRMANDTRYGLGAAVWTADPQHGMDLAARFAAGSVTVNGMTVSDPRMPFGGVKESGYGRELAAFGLREFTNVQAVTVHPAAGPDSDAPPTE